MHKRNIREHLMLTSFPVLLLATDSLIKIQNTNRFGLSGLLTLVLDDLLYYLLYFWTFKVTCWKFWLLASTYNLQLQSSLNFEQLVKCWH
jgi:hypothetical protein